MVLEKLQQQERKLFGPPEQKSVWTPTPHLDGRIIWLSDPSQKTYEDRLILPGEMYKVTLYSMISEKQHCLKPLHGVFLSKPGPPGKVRAFSSDAMQDLI